LRVLANPHDLARSTSAIEQSQRRRVELEKRFLEIDRPHDRPRMAPCASCVVYEVTFSNMQLE
jgi:hypothetical protein